MGKGAGAVTTPERDTRYIEQASTLYGDLFAMFVEQEKAVDTGDDERASEIEQDTLTYLARRCYDIAQGESE